MTSLKCQDGPSQAYSHCTDPEQTKKKNEGATS